MEESSSESDGSTDCGEGEDEEDVLAEALVCISAPAGPAFGWMLRRADLVHD